MNEKNSLKLSIQILHFTMKSKRRKREYDHTSTTKAMGQEAPKQCWFLFLPSYYCGIFIYFKLYIRLEQEVTLSYTCVASK